MVEFKFISIDDSKKLLKDESLNLFQELFWWQILEIGFKKKCKVALIIDDNENKALLPLFFHRFGPILRVGSPLRGTFTPYIGFIWLSNNINDKHKIKYLKVIIDALVDYGANWIELSCNSDNKSNYDDLLSLGFTFKDAKTIEYIVKNSTNSTWPAIEEVKNLTVTRYIFNENAHYLSTRNGFVFELKNNKLRRVLDLNTESLYPFIDATVEGGILGIATKGELFYVSYSSKDINGLISLVVDEYSMNFTESRNIIKIEEHDSIHFGGNILFDSVGMLYLSVGDTGQSEYLETHVSQNLNSLNGKILQIDASKSKPKPKIVAYGVRSPWSVSIDSKDRMFILECGLKTVEALYLLNDLNSDTPVNLGWPIFEGSRRMKKNHLTSNDVLAPIFEYTKRPGCAAGGIYLDHIESFLLGDLYGDTRILKEKENGEWYLYHINQPFKTFNFGFGFDNKTKKIYQTPGSLEIEILINQIKL